MSRLTSKITPIPPVTDLQLAILRTLDHLAKEARLTSNNYPEVLAREVEAFVGATPRQSSAATYTALTALVIKKLLTRKTDAEYLGRGRKRIRFYPTELANRLLLYHEGRDIKLINGGFFKKGPAIKHGLK